jgi:stearoyl-CoA desaturase (Delta-9 desaturase)
LDWDPSKWIILGLNRLGFATGLRRARDIDMKEAAAYMHLKIHHGVSYDSEDSNEWGGEVWDMYKVEEYVKATPGRCVVLVHGYVVDVTGYLGEHVSLTLFF